MRRWYGRHKGVYDYMMRPHTTFLLTVYAVLWAWVAWLLHMATDMPLLVAACTAAVTFLLCMDDWPEHAWCGLRVVCALPWYAWNALYVVGGWIRGKVA